MKFCNKKKKNSKDGHSHHMWMMVLCCGLPIVLILMISLLGTGFLGLKVALTGILPFLCPVMMLIMIPMMFRKSKNEGYHEEMTAENVENDKSSSNERLN